MAIKTLEDGTTYVKPALYKGQTLRGEYLITYKIDGIRMLRAKKSFSYEGEAYPEGAPISRAYKPLYNLNHIPKDIKDAEIYRKDWNTSASLVRTQLKDTGVTLSDVYSLNPIDPRLIIGTFEDPSEELLDSLLDTALAEGYEGLVIHKGDSAYKHVPREYADVLITGMEIGTGKFEGMLGKLWTNHGKIGTGFSTEERAQIWADYTNEPVTYTYRNPSKRKGEEKWLSKTCKPNPHMCIIGHIVEASYREMTKDNKMRFTAYEKTRWDKNTETLPWLS